MMSVGTGRRTIMIGPRDPVDGRWLATLTIEGDEPQVFALTPVGSWHDIVDHEATFEADRVHVLPASLREMIEAGVGPPKPAT
jgi:hypothetical protein